jgi:hypothetical protein
VCVQADLSRYLTCWVLWAVERSFISYKDLLPTLKHHYLGSAEESGTLINLCQECVEAQRGPKHLSVALSGPVTASPLTAYVDQASSLPMA